MEETYGLVADVGGTNIRVALIDLDSGKQGQVYTYLCKEFATLGDAIRQFLQEVNRQVHHACIDVACPVDEDHIELTNNHWAFSIRELRRELDLESLHVINDYTAIAMAIPGLGLDQKIKIGDGESLEKMPIAVCGPGTGLGVAFLKNYENQWVCLEGEGGHVDFAPHNEMEIFLLNRLLQSYTHVSSERFITGPGLVNIYQSVKEYFKEEAEDLTPAEISAKAVTGEDYRCRESLQIFCELLGSFAGNLALTIWASGGVYIAGGIAPRIVDFIKESGFRNRFEEKGRFKEKIKKIPTYIVTESQPGLLGAGAYLLQKLQRQV